MSRDPFMKFLTALFCPKDCEDRCFIAETVKEKKELEEQLMDFIFDKESADRIARAIRSHNLSLKNCADMIEIIAPLCDYMTGSGATDYIWLYVKRRLCRYEASEE